MSQESYQQIAKAGRSLMLKQPFYGLFLLGLNKELNTKIQTACVAKDRINIKLMVNPDYYGKQDTKTQIGILQHELLHVAMQHLNIFDQFPNKQLLNVAADLEINQYIPDEFKGETWEGLEIVDGQFKGVQLPLRAGTRVYYDLLQKELDRAEQEKQEQGEKGEGEGEGGQGDGQGQGDGEQSFADWFNGMGDEDIHSEWKDFEELSEAEKKLIQKQIDHQLKEAAESVMKSQGSLPGEMERYIKALFEKQEQVIDWKQYLRRFGSRSVKIETKKTRKKPNIRFNSGPAIKIKPKRTTLVGIDTSGSVSAQDLVEFFAEIDNIYRSGTSVTIMECDTHVHRTYEYDGKMKEVERVMGGGGTDMNPILEEMKKHGGRFQNVIILTDGWVPDITKKPLVPVLWVFNSNGTFNERLPGAKVQIKRK